MKRHLFLVLFTVCLLSCAQDQKVPVDVLPGAYQFTEYLPSIQGKKVALFVNHTSIVGQTHLTDTLISQGIEITKIFTPEHGFMGNLADGEIIEKENFKRSFELISLYGNFKKPTDEHMTDIDILLIDIQDVGVRFYTYASTMTYLMEACARKGIPVLILDRPNPNGSYVDGPVFNKYFSSFVGLHPIPIVHGLTFGELALMINGEGWLENGNTCDINVIKVKNWDHSKPYSLPIKPSPNLPNDLAIALYPSLALFEGTIVSVGRGTEIPFQTMGHPDYPDSTFSFVPTPNEGSKYPPLEGETCFGIDLSVNTISYQFTLKYLIDFYSALNGKTEKPFFNSYFVKLAGTDQLQKQIEAGLTEAEIRESWKDGLDAFRMRRERYLLYP